MERAKTDKEIESESLRSQLKAALGSTAMSSLSNNSILPDGIECDSSTSTCEKNSLPELRARYDTIGVHLKPCTIVDFYIAYISQPIREDDHLYLLIRLAGMCTPCRNLRKYKASGVPLFYFWCLALRNYGITL